MVAGRTTTSAFCQSNIRARMARLTRALLRQPAVAALRADEQCKLTAEEKVLSLNRLGCAEQEDDEPKDVREQVNRDLEVTMRRSCHKLQF